MDAGDPLPGAVYGARVGAWRAAAKRLAWSALVCCHVSGLARGSVCGRGVPQFVSQCPMRALWSRPRI